MTKRTTYKWWGQALSKLFYAISRHSSSTKLGAKCGLIKLPSLDVLSISMIFNFAVLHGFTLFHEKLRRLAIYVRCPA